MNSLGLKRILLICFPIPKIMYIPENRYKKKVVKKLNLLVNYQYSIRDSTLYHIHCSLPDSTNIQINSESVILKACSVTG